MLRRYSFTKLGLVPTTEQIFIGIAEYSLLEGNPGG
jgi:hypothetical protein